MDDEFVNARSTRARQLTEKYRLVKLEASKKRNKKLFGQLKAHCEVLLRVTQDPTKLSVLRVEYERWLITYNDLKEAEAELKMYMSREEWQERERKIGTDKRMFSFAQAQVETVLRHYDQPKERKKKKSTSLPTREKKEKRQDRPSLPEQTDVMQGRMQRGEPYKATARRNVTEPMEFPIASTPRRRMSASEYDQEEDYELSEIEEKENVNLSMHTISDTNSNVSRASRSRSHIYHALDPFLYKRSQEARVKAKKEMLTVPQYSDNAGMVSEIQGYIPPPKKYVPPPGWYIPPPEEFVPPGRKSITSPRKVIPPEYSSPPPVPRYEPAPRPIPRYESEYMPRYEDRTDSSPVPRYSQAPPAATEDERRPRRLKKESDNSSVLEAITRLAEVLENKLGQGKKHHKLPNMEPEIFKGDIMTFPLWMSSFEVLVEKNVKDSGERLYFLGHYTAGDAYETIKGFLHLKLGDDADEVYIRAKCLMINQYGDKVRIADAYKRKLSNWSTIKDGDGAALTKFSNFLWQCQSAMDSMGHLAALNDSDEITKIIRRLPGNLIDRWQRIVDFWMYGDQVDNTKMIVTATDCSPPFVELCRFVASEARIANGPCSLKKEIPKTGEKKTEAEKSKKRTPAATSLQTTAEEKKPSKETEKKEKRIPRCHYCKKEHYTFQCDDFLKQKLEFRQAFVKDNGMCYGCLRKGHMYKGCRTKNADLWKDRVRPEKPVDEDKTDEVVEEKGKETAAVNLATMISQGTKHCTAILPVDVWHSSRPNIVVRTYCALDSQSNSTFIKKTLVEDLKAPNRKVNLELTTMGSSGVIKSAAVQGLMIRGVSEDSSVRLPNTYVREAIPAQKEAIPNKEDVQNWPHLKEVADKLMPVDEALDIGLLVGFNCAEALKTVKYVNGEKHEPYGQKTILGWSVTGPVKKKENQRHVSTVCFTTQAKEITADLFRKAFDVDFEGKDTDEKMSQEDNRFLQIMEDSFTITEDNHFQMDLPFKEDDVLMPNNRSVAEKCLNNLKRKLMKDQVLKERYIEFMTTIFRLGHAEKIPVEEIIGIIGRIWYLPHLGVYHPRKPDQLRVVFHASIVYMLFCLNKLLLTGPDLTNNLIGVLIRFREEKVGITCDVEKMFHQVRVSPEYRDFMRFLWFENDDPNAAVTENRMTVHFFGAASSPGCSNYAFKAVAKVHGHKYSKDVSDFITRHFYVDDGLASKPDDDTALKLINDSHQICQEGGFNLHKYNCTSRAVLDRIPEKLKAKSVKEVDLLKGLMPVETTLGIKLDLDKDEFLFAVMLRMDARTRRTMLSALSSIYDPIGFVSAVILPGRAVLQKLCQLRLDWDEEINEELMEEWDNWYQQLTDLNNVTIPRCLRRTVTLPIVTCQLHHFCDASMIGYGTASYLRIMDGDGRVDVSLIFSKARVNPTKPVTVPRLELQAGVLAAKTGRFLESEVPYEEVEHYIWSDSRVVLGYVHNTSKRFNIYVANRVQTIKERLPEATWLHVSTTENPADLASRGCTVKELQDSDVWWKGPTFLHTDDKEFTDDTPYEVEDSDPEVKKEAVSLSTEVTIQNPLMRVAERCSSWTRLKKQVACWIKYVRILKRRIQNKTVVETKTELKNRLNRSRDISSSVLNVQLVKDAEKAIMLTVQKESFPEFYESLEKGHYPRSRKDCRKRKSKIKKHTNLYRLDVYKDSEGLLRVGGRLKRGNLPESQKHPILIPKGHHIAQLVIRRCHEETAHSGRNITLNNVRQRGYWVVHGRSRVEKVIKKCVRCKKMRGKPQEQFMQDLPKERTEPSEPFVHTGADVFGPFLVRVNRSYQKRWCVLFTCLACRAVHLEMLCNMDTSSFINAYRRLVARRGAVRVIYCDRGTNFVGASSELRKALQEMDMKDLTEKLVNEECDLLEFKFNFPKSSHMGGSWERLIRCVRGVLTQMITQHQAQLNDELLYTFLLEAESIINSRPLSYIDMSSPDNDPITPAQLLTLKTKIVLPPPGVFVKEDLYCRATWRRVQFLANVFWDKWKHDYLPSLHERRKWNEVKDNVQIDDVVLICDDSLPRNQWNMGRILQIHPGDDDLVRKVTLRTKSGTYDRPIHKLIVLIKKSDETPQVDVNCPVN